MPGTGLTIVLDPDEAALELRLNTAGKSGYALLSPLKKTTPQNEKQWAFNIDTEGELSAGGKDKNIEIVPKLRIYGEDEEDFRERQLALEQKADKLDKEGGTLRLYYPDGSWIDYEVRAVQGGERLFDSSFVVNLRTEDEIAFVCGPFGKGQSYIAGEFSGSARVLECLVEGVPGSAPALAEVEISSPSADVWDLKWGRDSLYYSAASTAQALYQAAELTPLGGAVAGTRTIDGKSSVSVVKQVLSPNWTAQLSTDLLSSQHLTHVGVVEVLAWVSMPVANTGECGIGLVYGTQDLQTTTTLGPTYFPAGHPREGKVVLVSLGQAFLPCPRRGDPQWQGHILTRSTVAGDEFDILALGIRPLAEGNGRVAATPVLGQPAALVTREDFNQTGNLNGQTIAAAATSSGPLSAGLGIDSPGSGGSVVWSNPGGVTAPGGTAAETPLMGLNEATHFLKATNFGFALPKTATPNGILFEILWKSEQEVFELSANAIKGGTVQTANRANTTVPLPSSYSYAPKGSATDLFGASWLYSDINASGFGIAIALLGHGGPTGCRASIDHVRATVYWTDGEGQKWVTSGDAVDFALEGTGHFARRSEDNDEAGYKGRYAVAGTTVTSDVVAGINTRHTALGGTIAVRETTMARYVDENNWLMFTLYTEKGGTEPGAYLRLEKKIAGTAKVIQTVSVPETTEWHQLRLQVDRRGRYFCWASIVESGVPQLWFAGQDNDMATGGTLASGTNGFFDEGLNTGTCTRDYDQFVVWVPPLNAVIYEGLGLILASDAVERQGPGGGWSTFVPEGDYVKLAPAGRENRANRLVFIASPHDPETMGVGFPAELKALVKVTPRYRGVPDPA